MKCLLISFFNSHNIGDCMIADLLFKKVSQYYDTEKYSYSGNPNVITDINNIKKNNSIQKNNKRKNIYELLKKYKLDLIINIYRLIKSNEYRVLKTKIKEVDLIVIGGGNMIFDISEYSNSAYKFNKIVSMAKKKNTQIFAIALGIGPFKNIDQEKKACQAISKCDYITFRDQKSYNIYSKHIKNLNNVSISIDPVFFLDKYTNKVKSPKQFIGLNLFNNKLINDNEDMVNKQIKEYAILANKLISEFNKDIILFSTDLSDYEIIYQTYKNIEQKDKVKIKEINGFNDLIEIYDEISVLIGMRMHSMIIALTQGIPVIGISWQSKIEQFFYIIESTDDLFNYNEIGESINNIIKLCKNKLDTIEQEEMRINKILNNIKLNKNVDVDILCQIKNKKDIIRGRYNVK